MLLKFNNDHDANMRLAGTVVRYNGSPFYIRQVNDLFAEGYDILDEEGEDARIHIRDEGWDFASPPLGYVNTRVGVSMYVARWPHRKQKQGLVLDRLDLRSNYVGISAQPNVRDLAKTIIAYYPTVEECFGKDRSRRRSIAFHREFAIGEKALFYRTMPVADIDEEKFIVADNFYANYIKEVVGEKWLK